MDRSLSGTRVLLVEDELLVAMLIEDALAELGCTVVGPISRLEGAEAAVQAERYDCALLDVNLRGKPVYPLAELLARRSVPFGFVTGYGTGGVAAPFSHHPVLQKPFQMRDLVAVLVRLTGRRNAGRKRPAAQR